MRHHSMLGLAALGIYFCISGALLAGTYSGGDGTAGNPYQIANKADLLELGATPEDYGKCFILTSDIDLAGEIFNTAIIAPDISNSDWGFQGTAITGTFNGDGHIITNLRIETPENNYVGLFGRIDYGGQIKNVGIAKAAIQGRYYVGGLVGENSGSIVACYATGSVSGSENYAGGIVGYNNSGEIKACYSTCVVSKDGLVGGLVGCNNSGTITACYATGALTGDFSVGGLVGENTLGSINACFWDMQSSGQGGSSGGKGLTTNQMKMLSIFQNAGWANYEWKMRDGLDYPRLNWENTEGVSIPFPQVIPLSGTGTAEYPYLISTPQEFALLSWYSDILDKHIKITNDLDLNDYTLYPIGVLGPFTGVFDGNGHALRNVVINQPDSDYLGLFSTVASGGQILNLGVENVIISGCRFIGGLAGNNSGLITECYATGSINSSYCDVGGLVGSNSGKMMDCHAIGEVVGYGYIGGLVGSNAYGVIINCYASGAVTGRDDIGGLVGYNVYGVITNSCATSTIDGYSSLGGLAGENIYGTVSTCYASGPVGGLDLHQAGGLIGLNYGTLTNSYAVGVVSGYEAVGGLVGVNRGTITASFWDMQTSGQTTNSGGKGLSTEQMKTLTYFQNAGWADEGWVMNDRVDYPRLDWENTGGVPIPLPQAIPLSGSGAADDPYLITTPQEFELLSQYSDVLDKHIKLVSDLDFHGLSFSPAGELGPFTGVFDGNGHMIRNIIINQAGYDYLGLFSYIGSGGQLINVNISNITIKGRSNIGSLAGYNSGTIKGCSATGFVSGSESSVGGLVGENSGMTTACFATGSVNGFIYTGGIVGYNSGTITACYAMGSVSGFSNVGGLCGQNYGTLAQSYVTSKVTGNRNVGGLCGRPNSVTNNCLWDVQTSGQESSEGGIGKTTAEMQRVSTFTDAGWDFAGEAANGTVDVWRMCMDGVGYPRLSWEFGRRGDFACPDGVGVEDLEALGMVWLTAEGQAGYSGACDANGDGRIDMADFEVLAGEWMGD